MAYPINKLDPGDCSILSPGYAISTSVYWWVVQSEIALCLSEKLDALREDRVSHKRRIVHYWKWPRRRKAKACVDLIWSDPSKPCTFFILLAVHPLPHTAPSHTSHTQHKEEAIPLACDFNHRGTHFAVGDEVGRIDIWSFIPLRLYVKSLELTPQILDSLLLSTPLTESAIQNTSSPDTVYHGAWSSVCIQWSRRVLWNITPHRRH